MIGYLTGASEKTAEVTELLKDQGEYTISPDTGLLRFAHVRDSVPRIVLPSKLTAKIIDLFHSLPISGHCGVKKIYRKLRGRFYWPGMYDDIVSFVRGCLKCALRQPSSQKRHGFLQLFPVSSPFEVVHIDIAGPLAVTKQRNRYILVIIDRFTRWPELCAIKNITADTIETTFSDE